MLGHVLFIFMRRAEHLFSFGHFSLFQIEQLLCDSSIQTCISMAGRQCTSHNVSKNVPKSVIRRNWVIKIVQHHYLWAYSERGECNEGGRAAAANCGGGTNTNRFRICAHAMQKPMIIYVPKAILLTRNDARNASTGLETVASMCRNARSALSCFMIKFCFYIFICQCSARRVNPCWNWSR